MCQKGVREVVFNTTLVNIGDTIEVCLGGVLGADIHDQQYVVEATEDLLCKHGSTQAISVCGAADQLICVLGPYEFGTPNLGAQRGVPSWIGFYAMTAGTIVTVSQIIGNQ